jgi:hypothetical protein
VSFVLQVDAPRWRASAERARDAVRGALREAQSEPAGPGASDLVPVAKGNGYGLGNARLAREAARLGVDTLAVGTVHELADVAAAFPGDLLVLNPVEPTDTVAAAAWEEAMVAPWAGRVLQTVASAAGLQAALAGASPARPARVVVEGLTSMERFGWEPDELRAVASGGAVRDALDAGDLVIEGLALHLPLSQPDPAHPAIPGARWHDVAVEPALPPGATGRVGEVLRWHRGWLPLLGDLQAGTGGTVPQQRISGLSRAAALWLSHLDDAELRTVRDAVAGAPVRLRAGTRLWLGDRDSLAAYGTVLATHDVQRGRRAGYRQRRAPRDGTLVVVAGGTAHGVALSAPTPAASARQRVVAAGTGMLDAGGRALSPFTVAGRQRWFAEPPHMQVSLVRLPAGVAPPAVGEQVRCDLRLTTASFDRILGLD